MIPAVGTTVGLLIVLALVIRVGAVPIGQALVAIGWLGFSAICLIHLIVIAGMGLAWRAVAPGTSTWMMVWGRLVRDAVGEILPFSQIGGLVLGARAVMLGGMAASTAAGSTIIDVTLEFIAKLAYLGLGLLWLMHLRPASPMELPLAIGLLTTGIAAVALCIAQRRGFAPIDWLLHVPLRRWGAQLATGAAAVHQVLITTYRRKLGLSAGFLLHLACWVGSAIEVWIALQLAGLPLDFGVVMVIESLLYGLRTFAFAIPGAIGVQEAAYVVVGAGLGLTPELAVALSLLKRARDLAIGLPTLALWQGIEGRRLWRLRLERSPPG